MQEAISQDPAPIDKRGVRFGRILMIAAGAAALLGGLIYASEELGIGRDFRFVIGFAICGIAYLLAAFLGGFRWPVKTLLVMLLFGGLGFVAYGAGNRWIEFDGAMRPRWIRRAANYTELENYRGRGSRASLSGSWKIDPADSFAEYRGPRRDGRSSGPKLATDWKSKPPKPLWGPQPCGGGFAGFAVAGDYLVTIEQLRNQEMVVAYERKSGKVAWTLAYEALLSDTQGGDGPRATPTVKDGRVYSLGGQGDLYCIDAASGKPIWNANILADGEASNVQWGMAGAPLVVAEKVIVNVGKGKPGASGLVAYDRDTGKRIWGSPNPYAAGYSSPHLAELGGVTQVLLFDGHGIAGYELKKGEELWRQEWSTNQGINVSQPQPLGGDKLFVSSGYVVGGGVFDIAFKDGKWNAVKKWKSPRSLQCKFTSPVLHDGFLYSLSDVYLACADPATGKIQWKGPDFGYGQVVARDDLLIVLSETGSVFLVRMDPKKYVELGKFEVFDEKTWNTPALAGDVLYLRNHRQMAAYKLPLAE
jgi:outer membrane protein assembly factor BamB